MIEFPSIKFQDDTCFKKNFEGFDEIKPINVIIGKNNSGKSRLLNLLETEFAYNKEGGRNLTTENSVKKNFLTEYSKVLTRDNVQFIEDDTRRKWGSSHLPSALSGETKNRLCWKNNFLDTNEFYVFDENKEPIKFNKETKSGSRPMSNFIEVFNKSTPWLKLIFRRINAERDILPEVDSHNEIKPIDLKPNGGGLTRILDLLYNSKEYNNKEDSIGEEILTAFNEIVGDKVNFFLEINVKKYNPSKSKATTNGVPNRMLQIHLKQKAKKIVALDDSGSGLKTILLVLVNMILIPKVLDKPLSDFVFAFEELENNLHPALFRNLLGYIQKRIKEENSHLFLTTHSSIALDFFSPDSDAQILSVYHNGESAEVNKVVSFADKSNLITELGAKASDILQANGIVWVEGPSDRIYINKWISLFDEDLVEGRDYQCAFYGGSVLADYGVETEEIPIEAKNIDVLKLNRNAYFICDSDKKDESYPIKPRVSNIEFIKEKLGKEGFSMGLWILGCREIENYLTAKILNEAYSKNIAEDPTQYEDVFKGEGLYLEKALGVKTLKKVKIASKTTSVTTKQDLEGRFDWSGKMQELVDTIKAWNSKE